LRKRARLRVELAAANRPELAFLNKSDFAEKSPLVDVDGKYVLKGTIPRDGQNALFPANEREGICRDDEAEEMAISEVLAALTISSKVLDDVAELMATSKTVKRDIREFEKNTGVDTRHVRTFVYQKQESFDVTVDGEGVTFNAHAARTVAPKGEPVHVLFTPLRPKPEGLTLRGRVNATLGDNSHVGVQSGGAHEFRFGLLEPWQAALIEVAIHFQKPILATADEADSTCSLNPLPVGVMTVHNWPQLLETALAEFTNAVRILEAAKQPQGCQKDD
jgi:hypothetical protein